MKRHCNVLRQENDNWRRQTNQNDNKNDNFQRIFYYFFRPLTDQNEQCAEKS